MQLTFWTNPSMNVTGSKGVVVREPFASGFTGIFTGLNLWRADNMFRSRGAVDIFSLMMFTFTHSVPVSDVSRPTMRSRRECGYILETSLSSLPCRLCKVLTGLIIIS
jgi:hypothetical protein